jgi:Trypsin-like serine proteases, typically periplasmic, contain C-terminal PDZ domain
MRRLWLIFAQAVTISLAILFVVSTLRPDWLRLNGPGPDVASAPAVSPVRAAAVSSYAAAVAAAAPSVVNVYTRTSVNVPLLPLPDDPGLRQFFGQLPGFSQRQESTSLGSGVIVSADGYVLTNYHVVEAADAIEVSLADGRKGPAKVIGADPDTDLVVLKMQAQGLPAVRFADAGPRVGDVVLAIGNPFGVGQTTTMGIVSAVGRNRLGINTYEDFIQTDAAINPGNSGGALIDTTGALIGINTAIYSRTGGSLGIGFAIPAPAAREVMRQIIETGSVTRGWLGIEPQDITPDLARAFKLERAGGVVVAGVIRGGPGGRAGLRVGDILVEVGGEKVTDTSGLLRQIAALTPGQRVALTVLRGGRETRLEAEVGRRPARPAGR